MLPLLLIYVFKLIYKAYTGFSPLLRVNVLIKKKKGEKGQEMLHTGFFSPWDCCDLWVSVFIKKKRKREKEEKGQGCGTWIAPFGLLLGME